MVTTAALSLDQAPPLHVPFRLFLAAPIFLVASALVLMWDGYTVFASRWSPAALAVTHLIVIGFLGQIMCGALLQMLPVLAGARVPAAGAVGAAVNLFLSAGAAFLGWGFLGGGPWVLTGGAGSAALGFLVFVIPASLALARAKGVPHTVRAMRLALLSLVVTIGLGLALTGTLVGWIRVGDLQGWVDVHLGWGLLGWVGLLLSGIAFQVVPMFHVTPPFPLWLRRWLTPAVAVSLAAASILALAGPSVIRARPAWAGAVAFFVLFAVVTVVLQHRRTRSRLDATLLHWWLAMAAVPAAALNWVVGGPEVLTGVLVLVGVGVGVPAGVLFKVVPFLAWFHLQNQQVVLGRPDVRVPNMRAFLPERVARAQWLCHLLTLAALSAVAVAPEGARLAGVALAVTSVLLGGLILYSLVRYRRITLAFRSPQYAST